MNIVLIINENDENEWVKMEKADNWYIVYYCVDNIVQKKLMHDNFYAAVETLKEWESYFE